MATCGKGLFAVPKSHKEAKGTAPLPLCKDVLVGALAVRDKELCGGSQKRQRIRILSKITELQMEPPTFPSSRPLVNEQRTFSYYVV